MMTGGKKDTNSGNTAEVDYNDDSLTRNLNAPPDNDDDDEEEEIIPDTRQTIIEPSPVYILHKYDTDHYHRHHRRDESVLNMPKDINSTPVQVNNSNKLAFYWIKIYFFTYIKF